jgi:hypothetical protein
MASKPKRLAFNKLLNAMRKLSVEVNDYEICKRLEVLMVTSKEDLSMSTIKQLVDEPLAFEPKEVPEPYTQYVRHFVYMVKRNERQGNAPYGYGEDAEGALSQARKKTTKRKSSALSDPVEQIISETSASSSKPKKAKSARTSSPKKGKANSSGSWKAPAKKKKK